MNRLIFPLTIGLIGALILISLGTWQVQRLGWKEAHLKDIATRISAETVDIPDSPDQAADLFLPVQMTGEFVGDPIRILVSVKIYGAGHRLISAFETEGRTILVDRGYLRLQTAADTPTGEITITGNLHWPQDADSFTPTPDGDLWFARDVPAMAMALGAEPILVVARTVTPSEANVKPLPVNTAGIPNDHLQYAVTWFSLAVIWVLMTGYWVRRNRTPNSKAEEQ